MRPSSTRQIPETWHLLLLLRPCGTPRATRDVMVKCLSVVGVLLLLVVAVVSPP